MMIERLTDNTQLTRTWQLRPQEPRVETPKRGNSQSRRSRDAARFGKFASFDPRTLVVASDFVSRYRIGNLISRQSRRVFLCSFLHRLHCDAGATNASPLAVSFCHILPTRDCDVTLVPRNQVAASQHILPVPSHSSHLFETHCLSWRPPTLSRRLRLRRHPPPNALNSRASWTPFGPQTMLVV